MKLLSREQMVKLNTKRLLAYKNRIIQVPEGPDWDDNCPERITKSSPKWQECYRILKEILTTREHVE